MSKLQLVDPGKLNEVLDLLKKDFDNQNLMRGISNINEFQLREAQTLMESKKGNPIKGEKVVDFLKKKERVKREREGAVNLADDETPAGKIAKTSPIDDSKKKLMGFINNKKLVNAVNGGTMRGTQINMDDFVYDLSHNAAKNFHVSKQDQVHGLRLLKKQNMPSGYIRNNMLRKNYISLVDGSIAERLKATTPRLEALKKKYGFAAASSSSSATTSSDEDDFYETRNKKKFDKTFLKK